MTRYLTIKMFLAIYSVIRTLKIILRIILYLRSYILRVQLHKYAPLQILYQVQSSGYDRNSNLEYAFYKLSVKNILFSLDNRKDEFFIQVFNFLLNKR